VVIPVEWLRLNARRERAFWRLVGVTCRERGIRKADTPRVVQVIQEIDRRYPR
jgi:hypothetical protein